MITNARDGAAQPTVVLVHGAFAESASWNGVIQRLQEEGYTALAAMSLRLRPTDRASRVISTLEYKRDAKEV